MTEEKRGYDKWLDDYRNNRRCNEKELQKEADEYVVNYILSKKQQMKEIEEQEDEVDEEGYITVKEGFERNQFSLSDLDPELYEIMQYKRKHKKKNENTTFQYETIKKKENVKKAKKLRYNLKKNLPKVENTINDKKKAKKNKK